MPPMGEIELRALLRSSPFHDLFKLDLASADAGAGRVEILMHLTSALERAAGSGQAHGGAIASLVDIAGNFAVISSAGISVPTINLRIDYLRPAGGARLLAAAAIRRAGQTIAVVDIEVSDEGNRLVALGRGTFGIPGGG